MLSSLFLLSSSTTATSLFLSLSRTTLSLTRSSCRLHCHLFTTMSINLQSHAFAGNPIRSKTPKATDPSSPNSALESLKTLLLDNTHQPSSPSFKVLPFRKGRPLASSSSAEPTARPVWHLGWISLGDCKGFLANSEVTLSENSLVYLGYRSEDDVVNWAIDVSGDDGLVSEFGKRQFCFVELRTLMVATDWDDARAMGDLAIAGHAYTKSLWTTSHELRDECQHCMLRINGECVNVSHVYSKAAAYLGFDKDEPNLIEFDQARALLEWHTVSRFCGHCGERTVPMEAGRRKQCPNELCKKRVYPRVDPVVIMLVIDRENDRVLLSRQSRFVPRMWSCLAGFIEPGESLEEAVRRETWEETGIEVGEVIYHSSQPWPVGPSSMPCQLMVGFFAYAKSLEINVDKEELEDAQWHSREEVKEALTFAEYKKAQMTAAAKVDQMCKGVEKGQHLAADFNVESGELAPMFVPGPFAIAHHLISSWVYQEVPHDVIPQSRQLSGSLSNL